MYPLEASVSVEVVIELGETEPLWSGSSTRWTSESKEPVMEPAASRRMTESPVSVRLSPVN